MSTKDARTTAETSAQRVVASVAALVLSLALFVLAGTAGLCATFFSQNYALGVLEKENYYQNAADALLLQCTQYFTEAGLMQQMLPAVITQQALREALALSLDAAFGGVYATQDKNEEFDQLYETVAESMRENGLLTPEQDAQLKRVVDECRQSWYAAATAPKAAVITGLVYNFRARLLLPLLAVACVFVLWTCFLLVRLYGGAGKAWLYIRSGILGAGLALALLGAAQLFSGWAATLTMQSLLYHGVVTRFVNGALASLVVVGAALVLGALGWQLVAALRARTPQTPSVRPAYSSLWEQADSDEQEDGGLAM